MQRKKADDVDRDEKVSNSSSSSQCASQIDIRSFMKTKVDKVSDNSQLSELSDDSHGPQSADTMIVSSGEESSQRLGKDRRKRKVDTVNREEINQSNVHISTQAFDEANEAASESKRTKFGLQESRHHDDDDESYQGSDVELPQRIVSSSESIMESEAKKKIETESDTERDIDGNIKSLIGRPVIDEFENTVTTTNDVPSRNDHVHVPDNSFL